MINIKTLSAIAAAGIVSLYSFGAAAATVLNLSAPVTNPVQQTSQMPCIFGGACPTQPATFGYEQLPNGGNVTSVDAYTGSMAVDWSLNPGGSGADYTVGQITTAVNGTSFGVGIDTNTTAANSEVLEHFEVLVDTGAGFVSEFLYSGGQGGSDGQGAIAPPANNGTGWSDYVLSFVDLSSFGATDKVKFYVQISGTVNGVEQLFLIEESQLPPGSVVPVPAAVWLFGSGLLGLVGIARRRKA